MFALPESMFITYGNANTASSNHTGQSFRSWLPRAGCCFVRVEDRAGGPCPGRVDGRAVTSSGAAAGLTEARSGYIGRRRSLIPAFHLLRGDWDVQGRAAASPLQRTTPAPLAVVVVVQVVEREEQADHEAGEELGGDGRTEEGHGVGHGREAPRFVERVEEQVPEHAEEKHRTHASQVA
ncbi:MAG TPA: hypothetical protein VF331_25820 [Polyangiales bacterium]